MLVIIIIFAIIIIRLNNKINRYNENNLINTVLSRLNYNSNHYNIYKLDNKIYIKCHTYNINKLSNISSNIIKYNKYYYIEELNTITGDKNQIKFLNIDPDKVININTSEIIIDLNTKNYKITTYNFNIINLFTDINEYYSKIIKYLDDNSYYIEINKNFVTITNDFNKINIYYIVNDNIISQNINIKSHIDNSTFIINNISGSLI